MVKIMPQIAGIRLGLCCQFYNRNICRFRTTTAAALSKLQPRVARMKLLDLCDANVQALHDALVACSRLRIRAFRVLSSLLPLATHPAFAYSWGDLRAETKAKFASCARQAKLGEIRLSFHPDQFVLLGSDNPDVTDAAIRDLELHGILAERLGADIINIHGGGGYGDKPAALGRVAETVERLSDRVRTRLTFENDDKVFSVRDLLPLCQRTRTPLVYDVHHHRCLPDGLSISEATYQAGETWDREPLFHISSPRDGWKSSQPWRHADFVNCEDFPCEWFGLTITVDVEAKTKELALLQLRRELAELAPSRTAVQFHEH